MVKRDIHYALNYKNLQYTNQVAIKNATLFRFSFQPSVEILAYLFSYCIITFEAQDLS